jgi:hypothetical protein
MLGHDAPLNLPRGGSRDLGREGGMEEGREGGREGGKEGGGEGRREGGKEGGREGKSPCKHTARQQDHVMHFPKKKGGREGGWADRLGDVDFLGEFEVGEGEATVLDDGFLGQGGARFERDHCVDLGREGGREGGWEGGREGGRAGGREGGREMS